MEGITITNNNRPSNDVVFGLVFEDPQLFAAMAKCVLGEDIDKSGYVVSQKENSMGSSIYNKIRFDIYAEGEKIITADMQNGYVGEAVRKRLVYYACRAVGAQKVKGGEYDKLKTCVISFIFEKASYDNRKFITKYHIASDDGKKVRKYSDLLTIVEVNLKYYKSTGDANLNTLCEFLKIQTSKGLEKFRKKYKGNEFGDLLYERYIKVILDKDIIKEVEKMDLYQEKIQLRYYSVDEAEAIWKKAEKKGAESTAKKMLLANESIEKIIEYTELSEKSILSLKKKLKI